jgi:hypothetical protein
VTPFDLRQDVHTVRDLAIVPEPDGTWFFAFIDAIDHDAGITTVRWGDCERRIGLDFVVVNGHLAAPGAGSLIGRQFPSLDAAAAAIAPFRLAAPLAPAAKGTSKGGDR